MIVWVNGTHGVGKTTTSRLVQERLPDARVLDAEKVGETLMDVSPSLPWTGNFQDPDLHEWRNDGQAVSTRDSVKLKSL